MPTCKSCQPYSMQILKKQIDGFVKFCLLAVLKINLPERGTSASRLIDALSRTESQGGVRTVQGQQQKNSETRSWTRGKVTEFKQRPRGGMVVGSRFAAWMLLETDFVSPNKACAFICGRTQVEAFERRASANADRPSPSEVEARDECIRIG